VPVAADIVATLRAQALGRREQIERAVALLRAGDPVRVTEGPFAELIGRLLGIADHERVFVLLELLGRNVRAEVPALAVEAA
jgi:transcriptional antiterminator RfaH